MRAVPDEVELLSDSEHTRIARLHLSEGGTVIRKEPLGSGREERVSHETTILRRLADVAHISKLVSEQPDPAAIMLKDISGLQLAQVATPVDSSWLVDRMLGLARIVAAVHERGVIHGDINPGNILIVEDEESPYLVDFALAVTFAELRPEFAHPNEIIGTLPYLAPEQTGRTGRSVDRRADLYGLGATMFELATGAPPFGTGDPVRLIHDHLARQPTPPCAVNSQVPSSLSDIIIHLLEKEPDNRYQTADGLVRDLERVAGGETLSRAGCDDAPPRMTEPPRLVGRDREVDTLRSAFEATLAGESAGVVISGGSGVGKSALLEELRPIVTAGDGWYAFGRFDRSRRNPEQDGVRQAFRGLGRLLLAEPEGELAQIRERLLQCLGPNAGMPTASLPEFATLLQVEPNPGDTLTAEVRAHRSAVEILRAVASHQRPVAFVVDDIQWAGSTPLSFLDHLLSGEERIGSLLVVVTYNDALVRDEDPLAPLITRWRQQSGRPEQLSIGNLDREGLATMVAQMLHTPVDEVGGLAGPMFGLTRGNPYATVEMLNGLRREGIVAPQGSAWTWDPATLERRLTREDVTELMKARVDGLPQATRQTLQVLACLGGEAELTTVETATGLPTATVHQRLGPALDEGLLVMVAGRRGMRFHHDRMSDVVLADLPESRIRSLRLRMARRLAARPEQSVAAADQYVSVVDAVQDPQERHRALALLRHAADQSMWIGESASAERMLAAATDLTADPGELSTVLTLRHAALYRLGRLEEADGVYHTIMELNPEPGDRVEAARVQIRGLTNRNRPEEAIALGLDLLGELGWTMPPPTTVGAEIEVGIDWALRWLDETSAAEDLRRPDVTDRTVLAAGALIGSMMPACFFRDRDTMAWLALAATRLWAERGPAATLVGAAGHLPWVLIGSRQAYEPGDRLIRRLIEVAEHRDFEPDLSQARFLHALGLSHWFRPLEEEPAEEKRAREGLVRGGDLLTACYTFCTPVYALELSPTVDEYAEQVSAALAFASRTGNQHAASIFTPYQWLVSALQGEADWRDAQVPAGPPMATMNGNLTRALAAALFDDTSALVRHSAEAISLREVVEATYADWQARLLRAVALATQLRTGEERVEDRAELDAIITWMRQRAADMPTNFGHMVSLVEAERAWALNDFATAIRCFDTSLREASHRAWQRAYIAERSARFMLAHGLDHAGWSLLVEAREAYRVWGARAKVDQLDRSYPSLDIPTEPSSAAATRRSSITAGAIDMLGILAASRALSSETSIGALRSKVVEVLSAMTGATDVGILLWDAPSREWLAATERPGDAPPVQPKKPPLSVVRYVERTREPLILSDATRDDRFARDPYFANLQACSVLAVPVLSRGGLQAVLLLENRLIRDAFPAGRLEGVMLIAGQLAISLDIARLHSSMERKIADRTEQLEQANKRLAELSITDPLTGLANRRRLAEALDEELLRARRTRAPLSLAMVDIDHFKWYNDQHGHQAGDRCLQRVATELRHAVRATDLVARYGGEEFAVIMPETTAAAALEAAERLRIAISDLAEPVTDNRVVTASVGVATLDDAESQSTERLIGWADEALYDAKRTGRNRVGTAGADG